MSAPEWYSWYVQNWRESRRVRLLSWAERGIYRELIDEQFVSGPLPEDPATVARMIGAPARLVARVLEMCFPIGADGLRRNERATIEAALTASRTEKMSNQRRGAARAKWAKLHAARTAAAVRPASGPESGGDAQGQGQGQPLPSEGVPRARKPRAAPAIRQKHAYYSDTRFKAMLASWPPERFGSATGREAAFAAWEGQGDDGKARIEAEVKRVTAGDHTKLCAFSEFVLAVVNVVYAPPTNGHAKAPQFSAEVLALLKGVK